MAKKTAKKVGRPKGSKNASFVSQFKKLAFDVQAEIISTLSDAYEAGKKSRAADLMDQLRALGATAPKKRGRPSKSGTSIVNGRKAGRHALAGRKAEPKYQSKKDPSLKWAGRGMISKWMKAETKGTKLTKEDFVIQ